MLTGEVGAGKTVAVRAALATLDPTRHSVVYLGNPPSAPAASTPPSSPPSAAPRLQTASLIAQAGEAIAAETDERGRRVVLVLDEAQMFDAEQLEAIRLLSNAEMDSRAPFAAVSPCRRRWFAGAGFVGPYPALEVIHRRRPRPLCRACEPCRRLGPRGARRTSSTPAAPLRSPARS